MNKTPRNIARTNQPTLLAIGVLLACAGTACGDSSSDQQSSTSNGTATSNQTTTSNGTTNTSNGTSSTSNGTTATSNSTTATSNGTTATSNGTTATSNGTTGVTTQGLAISAPDARACEVVLNDTNTAIEQAVFSDGITGRSLRRGERLALAFHTNVDEPIEVGAIGIEARDLANITVMVARCFDSEGNLLDNVTIDIQ